MRRLETAGINFLRGITGYRMRDHKLNEGIWQEVGITDRLSVKYYRNYR